MTAKADQEKNPSRPMVPWRGVPVRFLALSGALACLAVAIWWRSSPPVDIAGLRSAVDRVTMGVDCAMLDPALDQGSLSVMVTGFVGTNAARATLIEELERIPAVTGVTVDVAVEPWPFCRAFEILADRTVERGAPIIGPASGHGSSYHLGESLILDGRQGDRYGYLTLIYLDTEGSVVHLLPSPTRPHHELPPNAELRIGVEKAAARPGERYYVVSEPLGRSALMAINSAVPLFDARRPEVETAGPFLDALDAALGALDDSSPVQASISFIEIVR